MISIIVIYTLVGVFHCLRTVGDTFIRNIHVIQTVRAINCFFINIQNNTLDMCKEKNDNLLFNLINKVNKAICFTLLLSSLYI